jgi:hypothetical protein
MLDASGRRPADAQRLAAVYTAARQAEWTELVAECGKDLAELDQEVAKGKLTLAELDQEEHSLERLRRWHRALRLRDVLGAPQPPTPTSASRTARPNWRTTPNTSSTPSAANEPANRIELGAWGCAGSGGTPQASAQRQHPQDEDADPDK